MTSEREIVEYRIMSMKPGTRTWKHRASTGARDTDAARIAKRIETDKAQSPGWRFKIERRTVKIIEGPWEPA